MSKHDYDVNALFQAVLKARMEALPPGASMLDAARGIHDDWAANHHRHWLATSNPIWIWRCLDRLTFLAAHVAALKPQYRGKRFVAPIPDWCADYLAESSQRITKLANLKDWRDTEEPVFQHADGSLTPEQCAAALPGALGFTRQGWSAFREYAAEDFLRFYLEDRALMDLAGRPPTMSFEALMEIMGWEDERNARRKLSSLQKRLRPPGEV